ncbi:chlorhexidine efflux transporter [Neisseriaceae bacterium B1]
MLPVVAYILQLSWWQAFLADMGMTLAVMVYAFFFNWLYDHIRLRFI